MSDGRRDFTEYGKEWGEPLVADAVGAPVNGREHHPYQFATSVDGVLFDVVVSEYGGGTAIRRTDAMVRHIKFSHGSPWLDDPAEATRQSMAHSIRVQFGHYVESSS
jgi:hypothetical protein